ncbi:PepSY-associated TM helix domain-containing protein [Sphingomonas lycopersici]|mgnify:FL=1|uniref:PepSY domain-containing protein n=1 Tax=Sphingomonas lycopersici TaxID=2951807 RepID=A0AA41ZCS6_9SPHN|nr:PepSY-associated TM helix domain-containing protein [Sphingomonas lycopersici]MCW6533338.1 PepSY domain-containing protein [Sphingomonas lycopersici]
MPTRAIDLLHRWTGGIIGVVLAILGLTGAILVHKDTWVMLPHAGDALVRDPGAVTRATERMFAASGDIDSIIYASDSFGLNQLRLRHGAGAYADQAGAIVTRWDSQWARPELWLFDLHHHLFVGDVGEMVIGVAGLAALGFVVTGLILWWRTRRTFRLRLLPKRLSRPAIVTHHRDLGVIVAPLLILSALTGAMMVFRPVAGVVLAPFGTPAQLSKTLAAPKLESGPLNPRLDWGAVIAAAHRRFPDATIRILTLPKKPGAPIAIRMKRADEWLPNGRTTLWFDAADGHLLAARDALAMSANVRLFNAAYPLHAAKVGGLMWRLVTTAGGLALFLLGSLAVWSFWFKRPRARPM